MARKNRNKDQELPTTFNLGGAIQPSSSKPSMFPSTPVEQSKRQGRKADTLSTGKDVFSTGSGLKIIDVNGGRSWADILADVQHWTALPFSHGMEMELIICDNAGAYISGDEMVYRMGEITNEAHKIMNALINYEYEDPNRRFTPMPEYIRNKLGKMAYMGSDLEKGKVMRINYMLYDKQYIDIDSFGRDGNVTAITYILELVTPPCFYAEELAYWASTLFNLAKETLPRDLNIVASAFNPASKEYQRGLSQGDHHHIGTFASDLERAQCYDMIRNFIPHLIALSVNSPIINNAPTDVIKVKDGRYTCPNCIRSLRLYYNITMLSSNEPNKYIPYLATGSTEDKQYLLQALQKASMEDARFQDVFPFTDWNTLEVRVMDAQLSICRRIGLGLLVQTLCYKARKLLERRRWVPDVGSETLTFNRKNAINRGLIGLFKGVNITHEELNKYDPEFADYYLGPKNNPHSFLFQSVQGMFKYLKNELKELGFLHSPFLKPVLQSVFGEISYAKPPLAEAEYQLSLYDFKQKEGHGIPNILRDLIYFTLEYSKDPLNNPLTGNLTLPEDMR